MAGIGRVGDSVSCGDVCAQGSPNVFVNGMPAVRQGEDYTAGHCYNPTIFPTVQSAGSNVYCNNVPLVTGGDTIQQHCCGDSCHTGTLSDHSPDVMVG